jgi:hypothetical protein
MALVLVAEAQMVNQGVVVPLPLAAMVLLDL